MAQSGEGLIFEYVQCASLFSACINTRLAIYVVYSRFEPPTQQQELVLPSHGQLHNNSQTDSRHPMRLRVTVFLLIARRSFLLIVQFPFRLWVIVFLLITRHSFLLIVQFLQLMGGAYNRGKNTCARTWGSKRGVGLFFEGGLFSGEYGYFISSFINTPSGACNIFWWKVHHLSVCTLQKAYIFLLTQSNLRLILFVRLITTSDLIETHLGWHTVVLEIFAGIKKCDFWNFWHFS